MLSGVLRAPAAPTGAYAPGGSAVHRLDPRVKQAWLLALVALPGASRIEVRLLVAAGVAAASAAVLPERTWKPQLAQLGALSALLWVFTVLGADSVAPLVSPRGLPPELEGLPEAPATGYAYALLSLGPLQVTRRGVSLATGAACLSFTALQSASLALSTTPPEAFAASIRWYAQPAAALGLCPDEVALTLLMSLRFVSLVFEEVRNLALGLAARGVDWRALGFAGTAEVWLGLVGRLFANLMDHAADAADAMQARGYRGGAGQHSADAYLPQLRMQPLDWLALAALGGLICATLAVDK